MNLGPKIKKINQSSIYLFHNNRLEDKESIVSDSIDRQERNSHKDSPLKKELKLEIFKNKNIFERRISKFKSTIKIIGETIKNSTIANFYKEFRKIRMVKLAIQKFKEGALYLNSKNLRKIHYNLIGDLASFHKKNLNSLGEIHNVKTFIKVILKILLLAKKCSSIFFHELFE